MDMFLNCSNILSPEGYKYVVESNGTMRSYTNNRYNDSIFNYCDYLLKHGVSNEQIYKTLFDVFIFSFGSKENNLRIDIGYSERSYTRIVELYVDTTPLHPHALCSIYLNTSIDSRVEKCVTKIEIHKEKLYKFQKNVSGNVVVPNIFMFLIDSVDGAMIVNLQRYMDIDMGGSWGIFNYLLICWVSKYNKGLLVKVIKDYTRMLMSMREDIPRRIEITPLGKIWIDSYCMDSEVLSISLNDLEINTIYPFMGLGVCDSLRKKMTKTYSIFRYEETPQLLLVGKKFIINIGDVPPIMFHYFIQHTKLSLYGIKIIDFSENKNDLSNLPSVIGANVDYYNFDSINDICWDFLNSTICGVINE